jgi:hypothetical protein
MDALVVGAGPTGLLMAAELARHGLQVRVIDRDEHAATELRALAIHARTVELLDDLGLAGTFVERGLRAAGVVKQTSALFRLGLVRAPAARRLRDAVLRHVAALAPVQRQLLQAVSERDVNYRDSPIVAEYRRPHDAPRAGDLAPDDDTHVREALRGTEHVLLTFGDEPVAELIAHEYRGLVRSAAAPSARKAFGGAALCLVRPDGYVGFIAGETDEAALRGYLERVLIAPEQP